MMILRFSSSDEPHEVGVLLDRDHFVDERERAVEPLGIGVRDRERREALVVRALEICSAECDPRVAIVYGRFIDPVQSTRVSLGTLGLHSSVSIARSIADCRDGALVAVAQAPPEPSGARPSSRRHADAARRLAAALGVVERLIHTSPARGGHRSSTVEPMLVGVVDRLDRLRTRASKRRGVAVVVEAPDVGALDAVDVDAERRSVVSAVYASLSGIVSVIATHALDHRQHRRRRSCGRARRRPRREHVVRRRGASRCLNVQASRSGCGMIASTLPSRFVSPRTRAPIRWDRRLRRRVPSACAYTNAT